MSVEVKICGLVRPEDAGHADEAGADYLGVVFAAGPRRRTEDQARGIWEGRAGRRAGVWVDAEAEEVIRLAGDLELAVVQLHGSESPDYCRRIGEVGAWAVWKAVRVTDRASLNAALASYAAAVDGILLEGRSELGRGGVGARLDWSLAGEARKDWPSGVRLILAGGLNAENVGAAIGQVGPDVVDVSSGVEVDVGIKDAESVRAFVRAARSVGFR